MATQDVLHMHCVVIELELVDEGRIVKYLYEHVYSYNWILREDKEAGKVRLCVWWREEEYKQFCTTPLRSFLKRLKNKAGYDKIIISKTMTTEEGVQTVCNGALGCISKYYVEGPLYPYLREVLSFDPPQNVESSPGRTDQKEKCNLILQMTSTLDISTKLNLLQKLTSAILPQVKQKLHDNQWLSEEKPYILPDQPSPLITEPGSPRSIPVVSELDCFLPAFQPSPHPHDEAY